MDLDKIAKLNELREKGAITQEEFDKAKAEALASKPLDIQNMDSRTYSMVLHFSQFCCFILPVLGWVVPLVMWLVRREDTYVDQHGRVVANWIISAFIYSMISIMLMVVIVGIFLFLALLICAVVFAIMGGIQAKDGVIRNYPMAIRFFRVDETSAS